MAKVIECVPNFSEGKDKNTIDAISEAVRGAPGVRLLDVDPGASTNRTVYTFVGSPEAVVEAALAAARAAHQKIDMTKHKGEHPRMGALDVCPFIPVRGVTEEECVAVAEEFGRRLAEELEVPVYLYGRASRRGEYRRTMPQIRAGEYEGLKEKLKDPAWDPDFGPTEFKPRWGGTVTGVRKFLIAYNVNVLSTKEQAHRIALDLREQGRGPQLPGMLPCVQGIGWYLEEQNLAQVSLNLTDYHVTPIHIAYENAKEKAGYLKLAVTGSEIVGLVPLEAILAAAEYYIQKENLFILEEDQKVHLVINRLGLSTLSTFKPQERIIEYCLGSEPGPLISSRVVDFVRKVGARTPAPGGGSVAALVAALGGALSAMVCQLTYGKKQWEHFDAKMRGLIPALHEVSEGLIPLIDADTDAFSGVMAASKLPKNSPEEVIAFEEALQEATRQSVQVPLQVQRKVAAAWPTLKEAAKIGNFNCKSDIQVGAKCLETGSFGAYWNVRINLESFLDQDAKRELLQEAEHLLKASQQGCADVLRIVAERNK